MEKGYFNITLTPEEIALVSYICNYVKEKEPENNFNLVRLAKIVVHVVLKEKLPIRLFWYDMGLLPVIQPQVHINYNLESEKPFIEEILDHTGLGRLNEAIDEGMIIYGKELSVSEVRKKQYEELKDPLYLSKLEIEDFINNSFLFNDKEEFLNKISKLIMVIPEDPNYEDLNEMLKQFAVLSNSLLNYTESSKKTSEDIINALDSIIDYLNALNATFKKLKGFEHLFTSDSNPRDLSQRQWNAKSSLIVLKKILNDTITEEPISLEVSKVVSQNIYSEFLEVLVG